jgi:tight adherence protein C
MGRVVKEFRPCPLRDELSVLVQEIRLGKRRRDAFQSLSNRVRMQEVSAFVRVLVHADRMGMGMAQAMAVVSEDSRLRRYHAAERFAQQAPLKMLLPLIFIMFAVLTMVAGPILLRFFRGELFPKL